MPALHGLRPPKYSADVDVWVEPARFPDVEAALVAIGWEVKPVPASPRILALHSTTFMHPLWSCEIDLHHEFPGFLADSADVFEQLWEERAVLPVAGRSVPCAGVFGSALILELHAHRASHPDARRDERESCAAALQSLLDDDGRRALLDLALATGSGETARWILEQAGIDVPAAGRSPQLEDWRLRASAGSTRTVNLVHQLRRTPPWWWPAILLRVFLSTERELRRDWPTAPSGRLGLWQARWWRLRRALPDVPRAFLLVWRSRRGT